MAAAFSWAELVDWETRPRALAQRRDRLDPDRYRLPPLGQTSRVQLLSRCARPSDPDRKPSTDVLRSYQPRSKRSRFMTLSHAATKSRTNFCSASLQA